MAFYVKKSDWVFPPSDWYNLVTLAVSQPLPSAASLAIFPCARYPNDMGIPGGFGSFLIAGLISAMLYGITTLQTYVYYMHYPEDAATIKFLVAAIWILDTLHVSFMCHALYYYLIANYGVTASLDYIIWSFQVSVLMNLLVILVVQFFFAHKIHYFCRRRLRWLLIPPIILFILAQIGFGMWIFVLLYFSLTNHLH